MVNVQKFSNSLSVKTGEHISAMLATHNTSPILLMVSGGSAFSMLKEIDPTVLGHHITITVLDERHDKDSRVNNFAQLMSTEFYKEACDEGCSFIDTRIHDEEDLNHHAGRIQNELQNWHTDNTNGIVITTMGIGPDGHTAGIMPYPEDKQTFDEYFEDPTKWVIGYDAGDKNEYPLRVTVTNTFLRRIVDMAVVFVSGQNKKEVFDDIMLLGGKLFQTPAKIIHEMKQVDVFTDING